MEWELNNIDDILELKFRGSMSNEFCIDEDDFDWDLYEYTVGHEDEED